MIKVLLMMLWNNQKSCKRWRDNFTIMLKKTDRDNQKRGWGSMMGVTK